ncbi:MAG: cation:proton antiporter [Nitrosotalea sp.]
MPKFKFCELCNLVLILPILYLGVLILSAKVFEEIMIRIKQPPIIGNVIAGIVVGPALFSIVKPVDEIEVFISIGIFFLFFLIGLEEIDLPGLLAIFRKRLFVGAAVGFLVPFVAALAFSWQLDMGLIKSLAIASVIGASSLGVTAKILVDLGKLKSAIGLEIFTVTAIIEFIAIIVTSVIIQIGETGPNISAPEIAWLFAKIIVFFGVAGSFAVFVFPHMLRYVRKYLKVKEIYFGTIVGVILLVAYFAELSGIHGAIGALLLGIAMSQMPKEEYMETSKGLHSIGYGIFIPIFFAGIGLHFATNFFELPIVTIVGFLAIIIGVKFGGSYIAARIGNLTPHKVVASGVMSKGAVDLALMLTLLGAGLLDKTIFSLLVFGSLVMMVISGIGLQKGLGKNVEVKEEPTDALIPLYVKMAIGDLKAKDVMSTNLPTTSGDVMISKFVKDHLDALTNSYLVLGDDDKFLGLVSIREIKRVSQKKWDATTLDKVMNREITFTDPDEELFLVLEKMNLHHYDLIPVKDALNDKKIVGVITKHDILQLLVKKPDNGV